MTSHSHVYIRAWQDGQKVLSRRNNFFHEPKWPVQVASDTAKFPASMREYHNHSSRVTHVFTTNRYKRMCDVEHECTESGEQSIDGWQCRQLHSVGHTLCTREHQFFLRGGRCPQYNTLPFTCPGPPPWTSSIWNRRFPFHHVEGAEAANSLQERDRLQLAEKMSGRTKHPKKRGTREQFFPRQLRRGVPTSQRQLRSGTEMSTWDSTCCAHDIRSFPQTRMWKR